MKNAITVKHAVTILATMCITAAATHYLTPTRSLSEITGQIDIENSIPAQFGNWVHEKSANSYVINPQQTEIISKIYSQTISRTYRNLTTGQRVMLTIAYGADQRDDMQMHFPEICYPAQGFEISANRPATIKIGGTIIHARQLITHMGTSRTEPVTYWSMIGELSTTKGLPKKLSEIQYGLRGIIPDGLLFRVSTIETDPDNGFKTQTQFLNDLYPAVDMTRRSRYFGRELA